MTKRGFKGGDKSWHSAGQAANNAVATHASFGPTPSRRLLRPALRLIGDNTATVLTVIAVPGLLVHLGMLLIGDGNMVQGTSAVLGGLCVAAGAIWIILSLAATYYLQLRILGGSHPGIRESYAYSVRYLLRLVGLLTITGLVVLAGLLLFIVPGAIWFRRYILAPYYLVDHDLGIREAMQRSARDSKPVSGYVWGTLGIILVLIGAAYGLRRLSPAYGPVIGTLLSCLYSMLLALRYKEVSLRRSAMTIEK